MSADGEGDRAGSEPLPAGSAPESVGPDGGAVGGTPKQDERRAAVRDSPEKPKRPRLPFFIDGEVDVRVLHAIGDFGYSLFVLNRDVDASEMIADLPDGNVLRSDHCIAYINPGWVNVKSEDFPLTAYLFFENRIRVLLKEPVDEKRVAAAFGLLGLEEIERIGGDGAAAPRIVLEIKDPKVSPLGALNMLEQVGVIRAGAPYVIAP